MLSEIISSSEDLTPERYQQIYAMVTRNVSRNYDHLSPRFFPNQNMQAKIRLRDKSISMLALPEPYIQVLLDQHFLPDVPMAPKVNKSSASSQHQYVLANKSLIRIGYEFSITASLGPSSIFMSYRNMSKHWRFDIPLFYALEILNRIHDRINHIDASRLPQSDAGDTDRMNMGRRENE